MRAVPLGLCLCLAACGGRPTAAPTLPTMPPAWNAAATAGSVADGWAGAFADPLLIDLIREAWTANHDLAATAARIDAATAEARIAGGGRLPTLDARLGATRRWTPAQGFLPAGAVDTYDAGLSLSWEVDLWGRLRDRSQAGSAAANAALADWHAARLSLAAQVAKAWFLARASASETLAAEALAANLTETLAIAEERYRLGLLDADRIREIRSALSSVRTRIAGAQVARDRSLRRLEILCGRYPAGALTTVVDLPAVPPPPTAGLPAELLARRPDLAAAEARVRAAALGADAAQGDLYPRIALTASAGRSSNELGDLLDGDFDLWSFAANLLQPIFQGGRLRAARDRAEAEARAVSEQFASRVLTALGDVESALAAAVFLAEREQAQTDLITEARALRLASEERFAAGVEQALSVLAARRGLLEAELTSISLRLARLDNRVDLHLALGGDALPPPAPETLP